jgi:hypothetical protein
MAQNPLNSCLSAKAIPSVKLMLGAVTGFARALYAASLYYELPFRL